MYAIGRVQAATGTAAVAVVVHGPPVTALGFKTGADALGPGNRANATVGRAVALALAGIGLAIRGHDIAVSRYRRARR